MQRFVGDFTASTTESKRAAALNMSRFCKSMGPKKKAHADVEASSDHNPLFRAWLQFFVAGGRPSWFASACHRQAAAKDVSTAAKWAPK